MPAARPPGLVAALLALLIPLAACGPEAEPERATQAQPTASATASHSDSGTHQEQADHHGDTAPVPPKRLRRGERRLELSMGADYTPSAPYGEGTDDYRCFLLDPKLARDSWLTGTHVRPGNPDVVHHVILFQVPPDLVAAAEEKDAAEEGDGWTCFGGTGLTQFQEIDDADWIGAWAPGGSETVQPRGYAVRLAAGTQVVMQVHYNLLAGDSPDRSSALLRVAPGEEPLEQLHTMLMPAPVELPCRAGHDDSPLCERDAAMADVKSRFGQAGNTGDLLHFLCGSKPTPGPTQSCTRTLQEPMTIRGVAGHMHLLGRSIRIETNPGTSRARTVLDMPVWDFDDQGSRAVKPVHLNALDTVKVTCSHDQSLRDRLPAFEGQEERYVVWGEGTTDEMCLGILLATRP